MNLMKRLISIDMLYHYIAILPMGHFIMNRSKEKTQICSECSLHSLSHSAQETVDVQTYLQTDGRGAVFIKHPPPPCRQYAGKQYRRGGST